MRDFLEPFTLGQYVASPDFWSRTFQNWQSEMLAIASMAVFSIYLRERGSPSRSRSGCRTTRRRQTNEDPYGGELHRSLGVVRLRTRLDDPGRDLPQLDVAVLGRLLQPGERLCRASPGDAR